MTAPHSSAGDEAPRTSRRGPGVWRHPNSAPGAGRCRARPAPDAPLTVCVLETVSIARAGEAPVRIGSLQQKVMLTLLVAYAGRSVSVDRLGEELWGEYRPRRWVPSIRTLANALRRVAGDRKFIHWTGRGYRLHEHLEMVRTDIDELLSFADEARVALEQGRFDHAEDAARRAMSVYGGGPWTTDWWYWGDLAADVYHLLGRALLAKQDYLRCVVELSRVSEELDWHEGLRSCLRMAREALGSALV